MPHYFFDVKNGHRLIDPAGLDCDNDQDALEKAITIAQQIAADVEKPSARKVAVMDSERREIDHVLIYPIEET